MGFMIKGTIPRVQRMHHWPFEMLYKSHGNQQTNKNEAWRFWFLQVRSSKTSHVGKLYNIVVLIPADTSLPNLQKWRNELWNSGSQWCLLPRKLTTVPCNSMVGRWKVPFQMVPFVEGIIFNIFLGGNWILWFSRCWWCTLPSFRWEPICFA